MRDRPAFSEVADQELFLQRRLPIGDAHAAVSIGTIAGQPQKPNEDAFVVTTAETGVIAAVFDGTTSLRSIAALKGQSGARFASHFLRRELLQEDKALSPFELLHSLNRKLLTANVALGGSLHDTHSLPSSTGTIVKVGREGLSFAHVGDCFGIAYYKDGTSVLFTDNTNRRFDEQMFALIRQVAQAKHISPRLARDEPEVKQALIDMFITRNNNADGRGSGLLNGDPHVESYVQTGYMDTGGLTAVLLGTDGLPPLGWEVEEESTRTKLLTVIKESGFKGLFQRTRASEDEDPEWHHTRYKHSDDATGILIDFKD